MRAYLDRHIQDPERRRTRLGHIARELLRPRSASELGCWLTSQLCEAVGATACTIFLRRGGWVPWKVAGHAGPSPDPRELDALATRAPADVMAATAGENLLLGIRGVEGLIGALWVESGRDLDTVSGALVRAIAETAGVILEQALGVEELNRDLLTGLLSQSAFNDRAVKMTGLERPPDSAHLLIAFRVAGQEAIAAAYGLRAVQSAICDLAQAVEETLPDGSLIGARFDDIVALCGPLTDASTQLEATQIARAVDTTLRQAAAAGQTLAATAAFLVIREPVIDIGDSTKRVAAKLDTAPAGAAVRVT